MSIDRTLCHIPKLDLAQHIFISDLDGTLLLKNRLPGQRSLEIISHLIAKGGWFTIATGRGGPSARQCINGIQMVIDAILHNGALTADLNTGAISHAVAMPGHVTSSLFTKAVNLGTSPLAYALTQEKEVVLFHGPNPNIPTLNYILSVASFYQVIEDDGLAIDGLEGLAMMLLDDPKKIEHFYSRFCHGHKEVKYYLSKSAYTPLLGVGEITSAQTSKGHAAEYLARALGLRPQAIVAFGDNHNDIPLLKSAGFAFCPSYASPLVQAVATPIQTERNEEWVAACLERILE